jgi:hypothetical protein
MAIALFATFVLLIFSGYPVAWLMGGLAVLFTVISVFSDNYFDTFFGVDWGYSSIVVARIYAVMNNWVLVALPGLLLGGLYAVFILSYAWLRPVSCSCSQRCRHIHNLQRYYPLHGDPVDRSLHGVHLPKDRDMVTANCLWSVTFETFSAQSYDFGFPLLIPQFSIFQSGSVQSRETPVQIDCIEPDPSLHKPRWPGWAER